MSKIARVLLAICGVDLFSGLPKETPLTEQQEKAKQDALRKAAMKRERKAKKKNTS